MRPFQWNLFAPALPFRENDPFSATWRVHFFAFLFFVVGFRHLPFTLRPAVARSTGNFTGAATFSVKLTSVPFFALNLAGTSFSVLTAATGPAVAPTATVFVAVTPAPSVTVSVATWMPAALNACCTLAPAAE